MSGAASGVAVEDACVQTYLDIKRKRAHKFVLYHIDATTMKIVIVHKSSPTASFAEFTAQLPEAECRYAVYDFSYVGKEGVEKSKMFFISWVPDVAPVKKKMLYASSKESFRRALDGIQLEIQATDPSEIEESVLRDKCTTVGQ